MSSLYWNGRNYAVSNVTSIDGGYRFLIAGEFTPKMVYISQVPTGTTLKVRGVTYNVTAPADGGGSSSVVPRFSGPAPMEVVETPTPRVITPTPTPAPRVMLGQAPMETEPTVNPNSSPVYLMLGHGQEFIMDPQNRPRIPPGITLVTITACGMSTYNFQVEWLVKGLYPIRKTRREMIRNPRMHQRELETYLGLPIRVYNPGDQYPPLLYWSTTDFSNGYALSGIVNIDTLSFEDVASTYSHQPFTGPENTMSEADRSNAYRKSVRPPYEATPIQQIFSSFPEGGVFYFTACRAPHDESAAPRIPLIRTFSDQQQRESRNGGKRKKTRTRTRRVTRRKYKKNYK